MCINHMHDPNKQRVENAWPELGIVFKFMKQRNWEILVQKIIEIQIEEINSTYFKFDEIYIYREDKKSITAPCYYVIYMAYDAYYNPHYVCYDTTVQVGPKKLRQIIKYAYNPQFKLYKVKVVNPLQIN